MIVDETFLIVPITTHSVYRWLGHGQCPLDIVLKSLYLTDYVNITVPNQVRSVRSVKLVRSVTSVRSARSVRLVGSVRTVRVLSNNHSESKALDFAFCKTCLLSKLRDQES